MLGTVKSDVRLASVDLQDPLWWLNNDVREEDMPRFRPLVLAIARYHQALGRSPSAIRLFLDKPTFVIHYDQIAVCNACGLELPGYGKGPEQHGEDSGHRTFRMRARLPWEPTPPQYQRPVRLVLTP